MTTPSNLYRPPKLELWSTKYQWLPCNISFPDGKHAKIDSYINNLHPGDHQKLYGIIEKFVDRAIPLWNLVYQYFPDGAWQHYRVTCDAVEDTMPPGMEERPRDNKKKNEDGNEDEDGEESEIDEDAEWDLDEEWRKTHRIVIKPDPEEYKGVCITEEHAKDTFAFLHLGNKSEQAIKDAAGKRIQVIVKLANIHLTPENPKYDGGSWHVEGQLNEHIVSTALYYYDSENITDSHLAFRTRVNSQSLEEDLNYEQGDDDGIERYFPLYFYHYYSQS